MLTNAEIMQINFHENHNKIENQNSILFSTKITHNNNNNSINNTTSTMTQPPDFCINNNIPQPTDHTSRPLELSAAILTNTQQTQQQQQQTALYDDHNNILPKIFAKNTQISKQHFDKIERPNAEDSQQEIQTTAAERSHENMNDVQQQQPPARQLEQQPTMSIAKITPPLCCVTTGEFAQLTAQAVFDSATNSQPNDHASFHNLSPQPATLLADRSDVRDTSSQAVLLYGDTCAAQSNAAHPVQTPTSAPLVARANSPNLEIFSTFVNSQNAQTESGQLPQTPKCENSAILTNNTYYSNNNVNNVRNNVIDVGICSTHTRETTEPIAHANTEMTLTKVEDCEEDNLSVTSSNLDETQKLSDIEPSTYVDDMKFEMKRGGGDKVASYLPSSMRNSGTHTYKHAPSASTSTSTPISTPSHSFTTQSLHARPDSTRLYANNAPKSAPNAARSPTRSGAYERVGGSAVLSAATDISKLANFGKTRRTERAVTRTPSSDAMEASVLPARTLLRRQRRLQTQNSEEKPEDALERLNRLKARISASLTEVKGVLQHYSVDEGDENQAAVSTAKANAQQAIPKLTAASVAKVESSVAPKMYAEAAKKEDSQREKEDQKEEAEKEIESQKEANNDEGPVHFRFVKKVRRRSTFAEDEEAENLLAFAKEKNAVEVENKTKSEEEVKEKNAVKIESETKGGKEKLEDGQENKISMENKETANVRAQTENEKRVEEKNKINCKEVVVEANRDISQKAVNQNWNEAESVPKNKHILENGIQTKKPQESSIQTNKVLADDSLQKPKIASMNFTEVSDERKSEIIQPPKLASNKKEDAATGETEKIRKRVIVKKKDDSRRASIAAVEASKIEPAIMPEATTNIKSQRRPSDPEAVLKKKAVSKKMQSRSQLDQQKPAVVGKVIEAPTQKQAAQAMPQNANQQAIELPVLPTVKEEKSSDQSEESSNESKTTAIQNQASAIEQKETESIANAVTPKVKRRGTLQAKDSTRRASIAAVEGAQLEPSISISAKTQRRPSDSEAVVKKKAPATDGQLHTNELTPKVKIITKVKRPSVKSNASATAPTATATTTPFVNEVANNSRKDVVPQITPTTTTTAAITTSTEMAMTTTPTPTTAATNNTTAKTLPTQLAIDDASLSTCEAPQTNDRAAATKATRTATKLDEQSEAMVATLVSPLRASEPSGQVNAATTELQQLAELVGETLIVTPTRTPTKDNQHNQTPTTTTAVEVVTAEKSAAVSSKTAEIAAIPKISTTLSTQHTNDIKERINQAQIPTDDDAQVPPTTTSEQVSSVDRERTSIEKALNTADSVIVVADTSSASSIDTAPTKAEPAASSSISVNAHSAATTTQPTTAAGTSQDNMPELQVLPAPVKAAQAYDGKDTAPPFNVPKEGYVPKKTIIKRIVRKNSIEKALAKQKSLDKTSVDKSDNKETTAVAVPEATAGSEELPPKTEEALSNEVTDETRIVEEPAPPKKVRKVKKKVIIKRQQRKLSVSDPFFNLAPTERNEKPAEVETLEKAISYVTDDEDNENDAKPELEVQPVKPLKSCLSQREYQIGDWVLYGERFKKTQIRWKKGKIIERITSISYKIDIDGKEVSAHISYIKKFTNRKVKFSGKEYLEIDYEQIAEEEKRARNYSIWNMV